MNRSELQRLASTRLREAKFLLEKRQFHGAYYLCGYAIECALKACYAKTIRKSVFPDKKAIESIHTHDLSKLMKSSGLEVDFEKQIGTDNQFSVYWATANRWSEESRYEFHKEIEARDLYTAISDPQHGVLEWIKLYW